MEVINHVLFRCSSFVHRTLRMSLLQGWRQQCRLDASSGSLGGVAHLHGGASTSSLPDGIRSQVGGSLPGRHLPDPSGGADTSRDLSGHPESGTEETSRLLDPKKVA